MNVQTLLLGLCGMVLRSSAIQKDVDLGNLLVAGAAVATVTLAVKGDD